MRDERETNEMELRRKAGDGLVYGTVVQLKHKASYKYVTQSKNRAEHDHLAMEVKLINFGAEGSWWRVVPADKVRTEGERVQYGDRVEFLNVKYSNSMLGVMRTPIVREGGEQHMFMKLHVSVSARHEVNSCANATKFQVCCMCMRVCNNMIVRFVMHTHISMLVCVCIVHRHGLHMFMKLHVSVSARHEVNSCADATKFQVCCMCMRVCNNMIVRFVMHTHKSMLVCICIMHRHGVHVHMFMQLHVSVSARHEVNSCANATKFQICCICMCVCVCSFNMIVQFVMRTHINAFVCMYAYTYTHINVCMHSHTHTCIHGYMHT
jgi:hypothetical protein